MDIEVIQNKIKSLSQEEIKALNDKEMAEHERQHKEFKEHFAQDSCYLCKQSLGYFNRSIPCLHWLLRRNKTFKVKDFRKIYKKYGYFNISTYLRWVANLESPLKNINDLEEEKNPKKLFEYSIRYKDIVWSFSCAGGDYEGHKDSEVNFPHYHFQMTIGGNIFIRYGQHHPRFFDEDLFLMKVERGEIPKMQHTFGYGGGMQELFNKLAPDEILKKANYTGDEQSAGIHTSYFITAKEGQTIKGEDIMKIIEQRNKEGKPLWNYKDQLPDANISAIISRGDGVPEIAGRLGGKGKDKSKNRE